MATKLNLDLADPNCDVRALFVEFISDFHGMAREGFGIDIYDIQAWIGSPERGPNIHVPTESETKSYEALLHVWIEAGYIKVKKIKYWTGSTLMSYQITAKGWKQGRKHDPSIARQTNRTLPPSTQRH